MIPSKRRKKPAVKKFARRDAWQRVATVTEGRFVEGKNPSKDRVIVTHGPWEIHLDTFVVNTGQTSVTYTRVRAYFPGWRELKLVARRRNFLDRILEAFGFGSRPPLGRSLTDKYVVKGKPLPRLLSLFTGSHLSEAIMAVPSLRLAVKRPSRKSRRKWGESVGVVVCRTTGVIKEVDRLVGMIEVVREALNGLLRVGEASSQALPEANT